MAFGLFKTVSVMSFTVSCRMSARREISGSRVCRVLEGPGLVAYSDPDSVCSCGETREGR
jgi:hypothetical protein